MKNFFEINRVLVAKKKLFSFFAISAIVLSMASCGGNDGNVPVAGNITIKAQALSKKAHFVVTAGNPDMDFIFDYVDFASFDAFATPEEFAENYLAGYDGDWHESNYVHKARYEETHDVAEETSHVAFAFYIDANSNIVGDVYIEPFKTMPKLTLNGAFSVSDTKTVHFAQSNTWKSDVNQYTYYEQWACDHKTSGYPFDLHIWSSQNSLEAPLYVPSADEWYYLFKGRNNAIDLCVHATVNGKTGLIILPDNWQTPDGLELHTDGELGFEWIGIENWYIQQQDVNFNGYEKNIFTEEDWLTLEFAGAVFLPAAGSDEYSIGMGVYWSSSSASNNSEAYYLEFSKHSIDLSYLKKEPLSKSGKLSIRPVRVVN